MMNAEKYLEQVGILTKKVAYHREHLMMLLHERDGISSRWGEFSGGSGSGDAPYVRMLENIEKKTEELAKEEDLLNRLRKQAEEIIDTLPEEDLKQVLLYRYLEGKNYVQIADLLFVSRITVTRWKTKAMELLVIPEDAIDISLECCAS